jgi:membrane protein DedA with SNARE-associated domain
MTGLVDHLINVPAWVVYLVAGALVFAEDAVFLGFVIPGETAAIVAGVASNQGHAQLVVSIVVVVLAAIVGDSVGYEVGRIAGRRIFTMDSMSKHQHRLEGAQRFLARWGGWAIFFGRFTAFFRAMMPAMAGATGMHYRRFLFFNALGGIIWGTGMVLVGYAAGNSYRTVEKYVGRGAAGIAVVVVIVLLIVWRVRRARAERMDEAAYDAEQGV